MKLRTFFILFFVLILLVPFVFSASVWDFLTRGRADTLYCSIFGCTMQGNIDMGGNNITNVTFVNVTNINVIGDITATGNVTAENYFGNISLTIGEHWVNETFETGNQTFQGLTGEDIELRIESGESNQHAYLYIMESNSLGFRLWNDGSGTNIFKFDAIDGAGDIIPQIWFDRGDGDVNFFANIDMNDNNITAANFFGGNDITALNVSTGNLSVDHIREKTPGHNVVFDNDIDMGTNDITNATNITGTNLFVDTISEKRIGQSIIVDEMFWDAGSPPLDGRFVVNVLGFSWHKTTDIGNVVKWSWEYLKAIGDDLSLNQLTDGEPGKLILNTDTDWNSHELTRITNITMSGTLNLGTNTIANGVMAGDWDFGSGSLITTGIITAENFRSAQDNTSISFNSTFNSTTNVVSFTWNYMVGRVD